MVGDGRLPGPAKLAGEAHALVDDGLAAAEQAACHPALEHAEVVAAAADRHAAVGRHYKKKINNIYN